jgi:DNA-binding Lrp family transcriptional regulator
MLLDRKINPLHLPYYPAREGIPVLAFVFIRVEVDTGSRVGSQIAKIEGVEESYELTGDIDIIAKVSTRDMDELSKILFRIRGTKGVLGTDTRIVLAKF